VTLLVYLDQNMFIRMKDAGQPGGDKRICALHARLLEGVAAGRFRFFLTGGHHMETLRCIDFGARRDLAAVMVQLSQGRTILFYDRIVRHEIAQAVHHLFGAEEPAPLMLFGKGIHHVLGVGDDELLDQLGSAGDRAPEQKIVDYEAQAIGLMPNGFDLTGEPGSTMRAHADAFAAAQNRTAAKVAAEGLHRSATKLMKLTCIEEVMNMVFSEREVLARRNLDWHTVAEHLVAPDVAAEHLPTAYAAASLIAKGHGQLSRKWQSNDWCDVYGLACAVVHSDVVVAEKHWSDMARKTRLGEIHNTVILDDLLDLEGMSPPNRR
jgi:hypothetical protein